MNKTHYAHFGPITVAYEYTPPDSVGIHIIPATVEITNIEVCGKSILESLTDMFGDDFDKLETQLLERHQ